MLLFQDAFTVRYGTRIPTSTDRRFPASLETQIGAEVCLPLHKFITITASVFHQDSVFQNTESWWNTDGGGTETTDQSFPVKPQTNLSQRSVSSSVVRPSSKEFCV
jgi:hypothetical protein